MSSPDFPQATDAQLAALLQNILADDDIDPSIAPLTDPGPDFTAQELACCYRLAWQFLAAGVSARSARRLVAGIVLRGSATPELARGFKLMRARFKHLRFICANCSEQHGYPESLYHITRLMGNFQDAFRNGCKTRTLWRGIKLWWQLREKFFRQLRQEVATTPLFGVESFQRFLARENHYLAEAVKEGASQLTARKFHELRKIISRRVALNDTRRVLHPSPRLDALSRYLATINGLMGELHDELVMKRIRNELDYDEQLFELPEEIAGRIRIFVSLLQAVHRPG